MHALSLCPLPSALLPSTPAMSLRMRPSAIVCGIFILQCRLRALFEGMRRAPGERVWSYYDLGLARAGGGAPAAGSSALAVVFRALGGDRR